jgi:MoxR-like ATPase
MTNILLADEINRATTKTQSALLEAMEEHFVTVDGESYELPKPFLLMATQNPIDFEGTYTLPEAQLDRFMMKFSLGYPDETAENKMALTQSVAHPLESLEAVATVAQINHLQQRVKEIHIDDAVIEYTVNLTRKTRETSTIFLGASPRATLALVQAAKSYALIQDREFVIPDDIKYLAPFVLGHRILLQSEARMQGLTITAVLDSVMKQVRVPVRLER